MGQKVHPYSFRLGYIRDWNSRWFARKKDYGALLIEDAQIRSYIKKSLMQAAVAKIEIERASKRIRVIIHSGRPGVIIGRKGTEIDRLRDELRNVVDKEMQIDIKEIKQPTLSAQLVAENIAFQLEKRIAFRRAMKRAVQQSVTSGAQGIKIRCRGRLDGAEIARKESYKYGKVPLQTIKADVDYGFSEAHTTAGLIGIKVWIYKGDIIVGKKTGEKKAVEKEPVATEKA
ncbi:MAG: 30S ribosomal protein S3 [Candidatus Omnitrophica bacterium]|nr:30S ribosomal protein S3 [Candidatus Omnitrophota bacterium]MBU1932335.1 30S ribosomal protein S3 [Candidatus Omnitrophota bacterium]